MLHSPSGCDQPQKFLQPLLMPCNGWFSPGESAQSATTSMTSFFAALRTHPIAVAP